MKDGMLRIQFCLIALIVAYSFDVASKKKKTDNLTKFKSRRISNFQQNKIKTSTIDIPSRSWID